MAKVRTVANLGELLRDLGAEIGSVERYRAVNGYLSMKARYANIPINGSFELTPFCNFDCKMCYVHLGANQLKADERLLTVDEWKSIIDQAIEAGMIYADITGGECLTYPGFKDVYRHFIASGVQPAVLTNGSLLTEEMVAFLAEHPPAVVQVTVYGRCEDAYERVCGRRAFHEVMQGIERAKKAGLPINLTVTPNRYIQDDTGDLLDLLHTLGISYYIGGSTLPARQETGRKMEEFAVDLDAYCAMIKEDQAYWDARSKRNEHLTRRPDVYVPQQEGKLEGLPCGGGHSTFHVNWKGELCPCIGFSHSVHHSIFRDGFRSALEAVQQRMKTYRPPAECADCELRRYCFVCPGERTYSSLGGQVNHAGCEKVRRMLDEGLFARRDVICQQD